MNQKNNINSIKQSIIEWNLRYPFDYLWRKKFNVKFGSKEHLEKNFIDMKFDLMEDEIIESLHKKHKLRKKYRDKLLIKNEQQEEDIFNEKPSFTPEEADELFDQINLDDYNDDSNIENGQEN